MPASGLLTIPLALTLLAGCGDSAGTATTGQPTPAEESGITGRVVLGPRCPLETRDDRCGDGPAPDAAVTVSRQVGGVVARATTTSAGTFHVVVPPGTYLLTADAGMSCELVDARVRAGPDTRVDIHCESGIR